MNQPLISILIPVYNVEKYIEKCLSSLFENKHAKDCEFVITNDCTTDNSMEIVTNVLNKYPQIKNVKIINHDKNRGIAATRNTMIDVSTGKYILNVDSDDYVENNYIDEFYDIAINNNYDLIGCNYFQEFTNYNIPKTQSLYSRNLINDLIEDKIKSLLWCKLFKKDIIIKNNIKCIEDINMLEDYVFCIQYFPHIKNIHLIDKYLYHYVQRNNSYVHQCFNDKKVTNIIQAIDFSDRFIKSYFGEEMYMKSFKNSFIKRKIENKYYLVINGSYFIQKKYYNIWPDTYDYIDNSEFGFYIKFLLKKTITKKYFPSFYFFISTLIMIKRGNLSLKKYFLKNN